MNRKKILWILLITILVVIVSIGIWQRNNIKAIMESSQYSKKEISQKIDENKKTLKDKVKKTVPNLVRDFTPEEKKEIASGKVSINEMVNKIVSETKLSQQNSASTKTDSTTGNSSSKSDKQAKIDAVVNEQVAKMYGLEAYYLGQLGSLANGAESNATSSSISKYISNALSLEKQCDSKVYGVLDTLKTELQNLGGDVSIVESLKKAYENEKSLKKAYYMSLLK